MISEKIARGDLLFHSTHGLCRVDELIKENHAGKQVLCYALVPKIATRAKARYVIEGTSLQTSGFHTPVSIKEANKILNYLTAGKSEKISSNHAPKTGTDFMQEEHAWGLAKEILLSCSQDLEGKNKRSRQVLERSIKGLVGEFAFVYKITPEESAAKLKKCLRSVSKINPLVLDVLEHAAAH